MGSLLLGHCQSALPGCTADPGLRVFLRTFPAVTLMAIPATRVSCPAIECHRPLHLSTKEKPEGNSTQMNSARASLRGFLLSLAPMDGRIPAPDQAAPPLHPWMCFCSATSAEVQGQRRFRSPPDSPCSRNGSRSWQCTDTRTHACL